MNWLDLVLFPIFYLFISVIFYLISKKIKDKRLQKYFLITIHIKIFGGVFLGIIYYFYYSGGDTVNFYDDCTYLYNYFWQEPGQALQCIYLNLKKIFPNRNFLVNFRFHDASSYIVVRTSFIFSLLSFNTYSIIATYFSILSFIGVWCIYITFRKIVNDNSLDQKLAIAILFLPSLVFWGSGLIKDSLNIAALGILFYSFHLLFIEKKIKLKYIILLLCSTLVLKTLKVYVLYSFLPALAILLFVEYRKKIHNKSLRLLITPVLLSFIVSCIYLVMTNVQAEGRYSFENLSRSAVIISDYLYRQSVNQGGSALQFSTTFDGSVSSIIKLAPEALLSVLFRPTLLEARNPLMLVSALENSFLLFLTLKAIWLSFKKTKNKHFVKHNGIIYSGLIFTIILGIGITIATPNLGSLSRYRVPFLPFFICTMFIIIEKSKRRIKSNTT